MKIKILFFILSVFCVDKMTGQIVAGVVIDSSTGETLEYVNIGVIGVSRGTVTDESGVFKLNTTGLSDDASIRISMIGYTAQTFTIKELSDNNGKTILLENAPVLLSEVVVSPGKQRKQRKVGTTSCSMWPICGWGGVDFGQGHEIGAKMELGESPALVKSLHVRLFKQSYDSCFLRLHVRNIVNELPAEELLTQNIIIPITKESGWVAIDLSEYRLEFQGDVMLSFEWVAIKGINERRLVNIKSNGKKVPPHPAILFRCMKNKGSTFSRRGSEVQWVQSKDASPSFYLTVL